MNARFGPFDIMAFAVQKVVKGREHLLLKMFFCLKFAYEAYMAEQSIFSYEN